MPRSDEMFPPQQHIVKDAHVASMDEYKQMYNESIEKPEEFWMKQSENFYWKTPPDPKKVLSYNFDRSKGEIFINWFGGSQTNICYNAVDRHVEAGLGNKIAFYWEGNEVGDDSVLTFSDLKDRVCRFANVLRSKGVKKGDRVAIYLPMIPELVISMLACARIGAVHSIVFGGFSASALADRLLDGGCSMLVTADGVWRGPKMIALKEVVEQALSMAAGGGLVVKSCIVVKHVTGTEAVGTMEHKPDLSKHAAKRPCDPFKINWQNGRDEWYSDLLEKASPDCPVEWMNAEDPLFILYTSGSTGKPKGVLHTTAGYMVYAATTFKYVFDARPAEDVYFCTADVGWITGHSYVTYGPLVNGVTGVIFEGLPFYPSNSRYWQICEKYKVTKFYTAPTAIRSLMKFGDDCVTSCDRSSLRVLGTVGEPINPEAWHWYYDVVGSRQCVIVDTYWQTETGGHTITPLPGATPTKPGSATTPFFGIVPRLLVPGHDIDDNNDSNGQSTVRTPDLSNGDHEVVGEGEGHLVFAKPWPGIMRTVYGNHKRFEDTYFKKFNSFYTTGDGAVRDKDGYYWITGRVDDMLNVSGHLLSTAEIEAAIGKHDAVAESAVVAAPDPVRGECVYCFVTPKEGCELTPVILNEIKELVARYIGPFARPSYIQVAPGLPKTRSGKIMRRILRAIAAGLDKSHWGDTSTLADPQVPEVLYADYTALPT